MKLHIIATAFNRPLELQRLVYDLLLQTDPNWTLHIIHDGPVLKKVVDSINSLKDPRIEFIITPKVNGFWGHPNRSRMLKEIQGDPDDYVLITNDDNQYIKIFVETFLSFGSPSVGIIYCNTIHNYIDYEILYTRIKVGHIDMGSFVVKLDVAKKVGFKHTVEVADGMYAEECALFCKKNKMRIKGINKALFIHN
jgi:GT2 family glycosyltransferase